MNRIILRRESYLDDLLLGLQRLWQHLDSSGVTLLIINVVTSFILSQIKTFLLEMVVFEG